MGTALIALVAVAPWLGITPLATSALASVLLGGVTVVAACHGAGQGLALAVRRAPADPMLAVAWGLAVLIVAGGLLMTLRVFSPTILVGAAAAIHTLVVLRYQRSIRQWLAKTEIRWSVPWIALLVIVAFVQVAGNAGSLTTRPFDDDGHIAGQIARLVQTGTLGDAIGYPRMFQLGGTVVLGALSTSSWLALAIDRGLAFALVLALVCTRIKPTDAASGLWAAFVVLAAAAFAFVAPDAAPCWSAVLLLVALYATLDQASDRLAAATPLALLAAALVAMRLELAPAALTVVIAAWAKQERDQRTVGRLAVLVAGTALALVPFVITRQLAWSSLDGTTAALLAPKLPSLVVRGALFITVIAIACPLLALVTQQRWAAYASAAGIAGIVSELAGDRPYATRFVWPLVLARSYWCS